MEAYRLIAERRIAQAVADGSLQTVNEKWRGRPLELEDDRFVPADLKMAYKILKNGGYVPQEILDRREVQRLEDLIAACEDEHERLRQMKKLNVLLMKMDMAGNRLARLKDQDDYYRKVVERVSVRQGESS